MQNNICFPTTCHLFEGLGDINGSSRQKTTNKNILVAAMIGLRPSPPSFACNQTHHSLIRDQEHLEPVDTEH